MPLFLHTLQEITICNIGQIFHWAVHFACPRGAPPTLRAGAHHDQLLDSAPDWGTSQPTPRQRSGSGYTTTDPLTALRAGAHHDQPLDGASEGLFPPPAHGEQHGRFLQWQLGQAQRLLEASRKSRQISCVVYTQINRKHTEVTSQSKREIIA